MLHWGHYATEHDAELAEYFTHFYEFVMTDEVQVLFGSMPAVLGQIKGGAIRALAVGTTSRSPELPNVATMQEAGVSGYSAVENGHFELSAALLDAGAEPAKTTPAEFSKLISSELEVYGKIVAGMKK